MLSSCIVLVCNNFRQKGHIYKRAEQGSGNRSVAADASNNATVKVAYLLSVVLTSLCSRPTCSTLIPPTFLAHSVTGDMSFIGLFAEVP